MKKVVMLFYIIAGMVLAQDMVVRVYAPSWQSLKKISMKPLDIAAARAGEWYDIVADQQTLNRIIASGLSYEVRIYSLEQEKDKVRGNYLDYDQINDSLQQLTLNYPGICQLESLPIPTYEGRWIYGVKISDNVGLDEDEPGFFIDGAHHAREWATPQVVLFFADSMLRSYEGVSEITDIIDNTQIYCFPVINVDGYVYDWTDPQFLYWRKNREPFGGGIGTDPNRNYGGCNGDIWGDWGAVDEGQATHNNIDPDVYEVFCGPYVNSGDETRALTLYVKSHKINVHMTYHAYGEEILWPWGYTSAGTPDATLMTQKGNYMASLVQCLGGGTYTPGQSYSNPYPTSGGTDDWVYGYNHYVNGISCLAYCAEVGTAFYQPEADLDNISRQNFKALKYLAHFADSIVLLCEGVVPAPEIYPLGTVNNDFAICWHAKNTSDNHPTKWELVELSNPTIVEDNLESGIGRWVLQGFTLSTAQSHSSTHGFFSGNTDDMNSAVRTSHPYLVQAGDSVKFWCRYNLELDYDVAVVEVSENTKEWFNLDTTRFNGNQSTWVRKAYSLENWLGKSVYIRFRAMTDPFYTEEGFYVDDISPVCLFANVDTLSSNITDTLYQFTDHAQGEYYYYVRGFNTAWGWGDYSCLEKADVLGISESPTPVLDLQSPSFSMSPNPFRQMIEIRWQIADIQMQEARSKKRTLYLRIHDVTGRVIKSFDLASGVPGLAPQGGAGLPPASAVSWDATDDAGRKVPAGIYFVDFRSGDYRKIEKAILLK